jgi:tight adherence protein B
MVVLAALLAAWAAVLAFPARTPRRGPDPLVLRRWPPILLVVPLAVAPMLLLHGRQLFLGLVGVLVVAGGQRLLAHRRAAARAADLGARVQAYCESLAAELAAGQPPHRVLARSVAEFPEFVAAASAAELGADVAGALRRLARAPGAGELRLVAAAWQVAHRSGAGLAAALEQVGRGVRARRRTARLVAAELAPAHATARMMAALPLVFVLAGSGLGGDPVAFLTGTTPGLACLSAGLALSYAGLAWLQRIADAVLGG